jgi:hypothetical protein
MSIISEASSGGSATAIGTLIAPGVGSALGGAVDVLSGIVPGLIRGPTKHYTYDQLYQAGKNFAVSMWKVWRPLVKDEWLVGESGIIAYAALGLQYQQDYWWGHAPNSFNYDIFTVVGHANRNDPLALINGDANTQGAGNGPGTGLFFQFYMWCWVNFDMQAGLDENSRIFQDLFNDIFVKRGLAGSGHYNDTLATAISVKKEEVGTGTGGTTPGVKVAPPVQAALSSPLLIVLGVGALAGFILMQKKGR